MAKRLVALMMMAGVMISGAALAQSVPVPPRQTMAQRQTGCDNGNGADCTAIGAAYGNGAGVVKDLAKAFLAFSKACELGSGTGCSDLGLFYDGTGHYVRVDERKAAGFQVRACDLASGQGCFLLGQMYSHPHDRGYGLPVDPSLARAALKKSCALKYADGCKALAQLQTSGR
jgi:TPR repeat protein